MKKELAIVIILFCLISCSRPTYFTTNIKAYTALKHYDYKTALAEIENNKYLKAKYNKQLYLMEKGRLLQLAGNNVEAAKALNEADELTEAWDMLKIRTANGLINVTHKDKNNVGFYTSTSLPSQLFTAPRKKTYRSEHYERMMINYTKAISFININKKEEALVEAKRLLILSQQLDDLKHAESNYICYVSDPFPELFAGIMYEYNNDLSNAFISYQNAFKDYTTDGIQNVYGLDVPMQLKLDILKLLYKLGYKDKLEYYEKLFGMMYNNNTNDAELILFIEDGYIATRDEDTKYFVYDTIRGLVNNTAIGYGNSLYLPKYVNRYTPQDIYIQINNKNIDADVIRNNQYLTMNTITHRQIKEREELERKFTMNINKKDAKKNAIHMDTRNLQSIPAKVMYVKINLNNGENVIKVTQNNNTKQLKITAKPGLQIYQVVLN